MTLSEFLNTVVTASQPGFLCLAVRPVRTGAFVEQWFEWPGSLEAIEALVAQTEGDVYFSPYLFNTMRSLKANVIQGRTIVADLDEANIDRLPIKPNVIVRTSKGRHQAYWVLANESTVHETLSRNLTYSIPKCDPSGWCLGHRFRLPNSLNYKYKPPQPVEIVFTTSKPLAEETFADLPEVAKEAAADLEWLNSSIKLPDIGPLELLESVKQVIPIKVYLTYKNVAPDRSEALWALMCALFRAGLSREQVYLLAYNSPNNKFKDRTYNGERELAKDVLRAQAAVTDRANTVREKIEEIRHSGGLGSDRKQFITGLVLSDMESMGRFIHTTDEQLWYVQHSQGRPIGVTRMSGYLDSLLSNHYGLNNSEQEHHYTVGALDAYTRSIPANTERGVLSHYDSDGNMVLLHCGGSNILQIAPKSIDRVPNGSIDIMFPWLPNSDPFMPTQGLDTHWSNIVFNGALDTVIDTDKKHAKALLTCWFLFLLLRNCVTTRPIVAFFGQPGSGKSTLFKRIYRLLYGSNKSLSAVSNESDFDHAVSQEPLIVLDNVDTWAPWLPDRLALSAANSELIRRKLYTDSDTVTLKRQALIGITAFNPKFGREDVVDRLLILTFERLARFKPESEILDKISTMRAQLWGSIVSDIQLVLQEPWPSDADIPQFRVEDFSRLGYRIAKALHIEDDFCASLVKVRNDQRQFNLGEDDLLVNAISTMITRSKYVPTFQVPAELWNQLQSLSTDPRTFERTYKNSNSLGKKLWAMQDTLLVRFTVDWEQDRFGTRRWRFTKKDG